MLTINVLGSGSSGNCALIRCAGSAVLVDVGLSCRKITERFESIGFDPSDLSAILLTHEHGDHVRGLDVFCKKTDVPVYCNALTRETLESGLKHPKQWRIAEAGSRFAISGMKVSAFSVVHDAVDPMGYVFSDDDSKLGIVSDIGHVTNTVRRELAGVNTLFVEANYDMVLLQNDTKRPWSTKQRILSRHGHLSNEQTAELVAECAAGGLHQVVLGHLSQDCNSPEVALETIQQHLAKNGHHGIEMHCASAEGFPGTLKAATVQMGPPVKDTTAVPSWVQPELF
ncbi:MAG: phosphoribosyl 1,2-cyclic phosphodiesterase [Verrucomicrobiales bacterium]|jgi:phosphoribosyl 1,2-cyclic phosphodiesterase